MSGKVEAMERFIDQVLQEGEQIGVLLTPVYDDESCQTIIEYDLVELSGDSYGPNLRIRQEPEPGQDFESFYREQCHIVERAFPDAQVQYMEDLEPFLWK